MRNSRFRRSVLAAAIAGMIGAAPALADDRGGFQMRVGAWLDSGDPLVGAAYEIPYNSRVSFVPNLDFTIGGTDYDTFNADAHYRVDRTAGNPMWLGAGLGVIHRETRFSDDNDPAVNLMWGMAFPSRDAWSPYIGTRVVLSDQSEFAFTFGVRFGTTGATTAAGGSGRR